MSKRCDLYHACGIAGLAGVYGEVPAVVCPGGGGGHAGTGQLVTAAAAVHLLAATPCKNGLTGRHQTQTQIAVRVDGHLVPTNITLTGNNYLISPGQTTYSSVPSFLKR